MSISEHGLLVVEITDLIAHSYSRKVREGKIFQSLALSEEIIEELRERGLLEVAAKTFINSIIVDLSKEEGFPTTLNKT